MMQIVIELSELDYKVIKLRGSGSPAYIDRAILEGVILPKGHGRMIDASDLVENLFEMCDACGTLAENPYRDNPHIDSILDVIENTDTIIPANTTIICPNCGIEQYNDKDYCMDCGARLDGNSTGTQHEVCKFLVDPIDVLENQATCEDCVSRQAVLDALDSHTYSKEFCEEHHIDWSINLGMAHIVINDLPSVTPQQNTGKWVKYGVPRCGEQHYQCTSCGYYINFGQWGEVYTKQFKYCPNCGTKMEVEE